MIAAAGLAIWSVACTPNPAGIASPSQMEWAVNAWSLSARPALAETLGLRFDGRQWVFDSGHVDLPNVAATAYFAQPYLEAGINLALNRCDRRMLDEVAGYYLAALQRFVPFRELERTRGIMFGKKRPYDLVGDPRTRTLPWIHGASGFTRARVAECLLCVSQFLHPASRLIHLFAALPLGGTNAVEERFVNEYLGLIVYDHVLRFAYDAPLDLGLPGGYATGAVAGWRALAALPPASRTRHPAALLDTHLWLIAEAAEVMAAHAASPELVRMSARDSARLSEFVAVGLARLRQSATVRVVGKDPNGRSVLGLDFFEGAFALHRDNAFAGYTGTAFPESDDTARVDLIGWDVMHAARLPLVLRSLNDSRGAIGSSYPTASTLTQAAHQLTYRVFNGDFSRPSFRNFMDGTDGWYRAGYSGRGRWGYPPSTACDAREYQRQCLGAWALPTWGVLAAFDPRLNRIASRLIELAETRDSALVEFRDRHFFVEVPFSFESSARHLPSPTLFQLLANFAPPAAGWSVSAARQ